MSLSDRESPDMCDREPQDLKPNVGSENKHKHASGTKAPRKQRKPDASLGSPTKPGTGTPAKEPVEHSAKGEGHKPTTKTMAYDYAMKAVNAMTLEMEKELAEELGVKRENLHSSWKNGWKKRVEKVLHDEFKGST